MAQTVRLIVVHGIGNQKTGDTAARWALALVKFAEAADYMVQVERADLTGGPAGAVLRLTPPGDRPQDARPPTDTIDIIEAHWADAFAEPSLRRVLRFLLTVAPLLAITQSILIWRQREQLGAASSRANLDRATQSTLSAAYRAATTLAPLVLLVVALGLAAPLVATVLLVVLLAASLPVPPLRRTVGKYLGWLTVSIGDSYLFVADPVSRAAMQTRLATRLAALTSDTDSSLTVVLAHSQGAAVAYHTISGMLRHRRPAALITIGSGLGRLSDVTHLRDPAWYFTPLFIAVFVTGAAGIAVVVAQGPGASLPWVLLATCALLAAVACWRCTALVKRSLDEGGLPVLDRVNWLDIWAPFDLVPNGRAVAPAQRSGDTGYQYRLIPGQLSVLRDHIRYDKDWGQTMPLIWARLLDPTGPALPHVGVRPLRKGLVPSHGAMCLDCSCDWRQR